MREGTINIIKWFFEPVVGQNRRQWRVVALSFIGATTFWLLHALNKNYTTNLSYPLDFEYDQQKFVSTSLLPSRVNVNVSGSGWELLRENLSLASKTLVINPKKLPEESNVSIRMLERSFEGNAHYIKMNRIVTPEISYTFDYNVSRPVILNIPIDSILMKPGFTAIPPVKIFPEYVNVSGARDRINNLGDTMSLAFKFKSLDEDFDDDILLSNFLTDLKSEAEEVKVTFRVSPLVVKQMNVPYKVINNPNDTSVIFSTERVKLKFMYPKMLERELNDSSFNVVLNVRNTVLTEDSAFSIEVLSKPSFVKEVEVLDKAVTLYGVAKK